MPDYKTTRAKGNSANRHHSFSAAAAAAAYGEVIKTAEMQTVNTFDAEDIRAPLAASGSWERASTVNLRSKPKRPNTEIHSKAAPFVPGLDLCGIQLQTDDEPESLIVKDVLAFPTTLAMIKPNWSFCFDVNCIPQLGPPLPEHIAEDLYQKYVCSSPLLRPGKLPYIHVGSTTLGFRLHFYLVLPNAGGTPHAVNSEHLTDESLQLVFDHCIFPALQVADAKRRGFTSWMRAMNESSLNALKSRRKATSSGPEMQEERIHCFLLAAIWDAIDSCDEESVAHLLEGKILIAYGHGKEHTWYAEWKPTWSGFKKDCEAAVDTKNIKAESRLKIEMDLGLGGIEQMANLDRQEAMVERKRIR